MYECIISKWEKAKAEKTDILGNFREKPIKSP